MYDRQTVFVTAKGDILVGGLEKAFKGDFCEEYDDWSYFSCPNIMNRKPYNNKTDIWSSGCILHLLLSDDFKQPFTRDYDIRFYKNEYLDRYPLWRISAEARALRNMLLDEDPKKRPSATEILAMPLLQPILEELNIQDERPEVPTSCFVCTILKLLHVSLLREYLAVEFYEPWSEPIGEPPAPPAFDFDPERIVDDFIALCMFMGNDFLPHLPTLDIGDGGLDE